MADASTDQGGAGYDGGYGYGYTTDYSSNGTTTALSAAVAGIAGVLAADLAGTPYAGVAVTSVIGGYLSTSQGFNNAVNNVGASTSDAVQSMAYDNSMGNIFSPDRQ